MERLLAAGADANGTAFEGQTMLMTAALSGKADAVRLLLQRGARVDVKDSYRGQTALMWAAAEGHTKAAELLLEAGAERHGQVHRRLHAAPLRRAQRAHGNRRACCWRVAPT